jgi:hypothetical protein
VPRWMTILAQVDRTMRTREIVARRRPGFAEGPRV